MSSSNDSGPEWSPARSDGSQGGGIFDMWLTFNEAGRPEMLRHSSNNTNLSPSSPESVPTCCPSLVYSTQNASPIGEIIFEGLISKDKGVRRRNQNRASQRAYRDRQKKRLDELQQEIEDLKALCLQLEKENKTLTSDYQQRWNRLLADLKSELEDPERRSSQQESVGWMLKHAYGIPEGADSGQFSVYSLSEPRIPDCPTS